MPDFLPVTAVEVVEVLLATGIPPAIELPTDARRALPDRSPGFLTQQEEATVEVRWHSQRPGVASAQASLNRCAAVLEAAGLSVQRLSAGRYGLYLDVYRRAPDPDGSDAQP